MAAGKKTHAAALAMLVSLFFMWGFITCLNDILIPYLKGVFALMHWQAMLVQFAFFGAYFIGSLVYFFISATSGDPINRIGYKKGILAGLAVAAVGTALFFPASAYRSYGFFLAALFVLGLGFTLLQITANPYVAILGDERTAAGRLNLAQGFNSLGTFIAPLAGGYLIYELYGDKPDASSVRIPYLAFSALFLLVALAVWLTRLPRFENMEVVEKGMGALQYPQLVLGIAAIFLYVGAEVSIGSIMTGFVGLPETAGLSKADATVFVSLYWGGLMIGRFTGAVSMSRLARGPKRLLVVIVPFAVFAVVLSVFRLHGTDTGPLLYFLPFVALNAAGFLAGRAVAARTLSLFAVLAAALLVAGMAAHGLTAVFAVVAIGLFNSIMWSNIFTLAIRGLGKHTSQGASLLVMAILGGALVPPLQGLVADYHGIRLSFAVPLACYAYLAYYGFRARRYAGD